MTIFKESALFSFLTFYDTHILMALKLYDFVDIVSLIFLATDLETLEANFQRAQNLKAAKISKAYLER